MRNLNLVMIASLWGHLMRFTIKALAMHPATIQVIALFLAFSDVLVLVGGSHWGCSRAGHRSEVEGWLQAQRHGAAARDVGADRLATAKAQAQDYAQTAQQKAAEHLERVRLSFAMSTVSASHLSEVFKHLHQGWCNCCAAWQDVQRCFWP